MKEFYRFTEFVDRWFEKPPGDIVFRSWERRYRTALLRDAYCVELGRKGCDARVREAFQACESKAEGEKQLEQCKKVAREGCGLE